MISEYYLVGLHVGVNDKRNANYGVRISTFKFGELRKMIEFHFIKESLDETFY